MIRIGKIVASHSLHGAMVLTHIIGNSKWLKNEDALFVELNKNSFIPFFVTQCKASGADEYIISLDEVSSMESAKKMIGKHVYVQEDIVSKYADDSPLLWIGFKVIDKKQGSLGEIADILQTGSQWLAKIMIGDKEVLLPLVEQTIEKISLKTKTIHTRMPDGLLEVYLGS